MQGNSIQHLEIFINKINNGQPFGVIRPCDGELQILYNNTLTNVDNWTYTCNGILREHLFGAINTDLPNLYIGIPCEKCNKEIKETYENLFNIPKERKTYANIFSNGNWKSFTNFLKGYSKGFCMVTPGTKEIKDMNILDRYIIDPYLVNRWDSDYQNESIKLMEWVSKKENTLICFSAGPISKVWIPLLMKEFPKNTYLDVGSSLDIFFKGESNRYYITDEGYAKDTCDFNML
jgi:hypothetical protein